LGGSRRKAQEAAERLASGSRRAAGGALRLLGAAWGFAEAVLWLAFMAAVVSAGIWVAHLAARQAGWNHPALALAADAVGKFWEGVLRRVGR
jgi:hydrogenase/urease accessory protein HupE